MKVDLASLSQIKAPTKLAILITAGCVTACVIVLILGILPSRTRLFTLRTEISGLTTTLANMKTDIACTDQQRVKTADVTEKRAALLAEGEIQPLLGSLAMRGKALLDPLARQTGFVIDSVREMPYMPLQVPSPAPSQLYGRQPVEFTGHGSYAEIVAFVAATEERHPLAILSSLIVLGQPTTPETHKAMITFEWPTKGEKQNGPEAKPAR